MRAHLTPAMRALAACAKKIPYNIRRTERRRERACTLTLTNILRLVQTQNRASVQHRCAHSRNIVKRSTDRTEHGTLVGGGAWQDMALVVNLNFLLACCIANGIRRDADADDAEHATTHCLMSHSSSSSSSGMAEIY